MPESILNLSKRTITKIMKRLNLGCSNCGWDLATCDIHHIKHRSQGGADDHENLTHICPNCHRLAHAGKLNKFVTLEEQIGDTWKQFYYPNLTKNPKKDRKVTNNIAIYNSGQTKKAEMRAEKVLPLLKESDIEFSKIGWVKQAAEIIGIAPNKVNVWLKRHDPEFLKTCFVR